MAKGNQPAHTIRLGYIKATIWRNDDFFNVTITRSYKDNNEWKDGDSFGSGDLPVVAKVADEATNWILAQ